MARILIAKPAPTFAEYALVPQPDPSRVWAGGHFRKGQSITSKFQNNALTEPYEVAAKLGQPRYCRGYQASDDR
jgi:hypothetical protein